MHPYQNIIISLFDYSGTWSAPYQSAGYNVIQVDAKLGDNILSWDYSSIDRGKVYGILAAPPCTHFTKASSIYWFRYDVEGFTAMSLLLIQTTLEIIKYFDPYFWALENPPGRLSKIYPPIAKYKILRFSPADFGDPLFKQTELYGNFCPLLYLDQVKPTHIVNEIKGRPSIMQYYKKLFPELNRAGLRSITPPGFARSFFNSNRNLAFEILNKNKP